MYTSTQDSGVDMPGTHDRLIFLRFNKSNVFNMNATPCKSHKVNKRRATFIPKSTVSFFFTRCQQPFLNSESPILYIFSFFLYKISQLIKKINKKSSTYLVPEFNKYC